MSHACLELDGIRKAWGRTVVLDDIDLRVDAHAYTCIMGPSGAGKSTLLRVIAGHELADAGRVQLGDQVLTGRPAERRPVHTVFQDAGLFPFMSVLDNVAFAGKVARRPRDERRRRAATLLEEVGLEPARYGERQPDTLSGGERQRVALARALFGEPALLLLDEPLSALDRHLRRGLRRTLAELQRARKIAFVHVTHEPEEAMALADTLVVLVAGRVAAQGSARSLYEQPPDLEVARLLGELSEVPGGFVRPERLLVHTDTGGRLAVVERGRAFLGDGAELHLQAGPTMLVARAPSMPAAPVCSVDWSPDDVLCLPP